MTSSFHYETALNPVQKLEPDMIPKGSSGLAGRALGGGLFIVMGGGLMIYDRVSADTIPGWVQSVSVAFVSFGSLLAWMAFRQWQVGRQCAKASTAELRDYPWDTTKFVVSGSGDLPQCLATALAVSCCAAGVFGFADIDWKAWISRVGLALVTALCIALWCRVIHRWTRSIRFGESRVEFVTFPYRAFEPVTLKWIVPRGVSRVRSATFTLRCIEEFVDVTQSPGTEKEAELVNLQRWAASWTLDDEAEWTCGEAIELAWDLPAETCRTSIRGLSVIFWRLDVTAKVSGPDFKASYLIPIY